MSTYSKRNSARRSDDTMDDDGDDKDDTKRKSRNLSEKKRRDQFNMLVNELSSMVSSGARKMDKSTVLRSTISFLKNHNEVAIRSRAHEIQEDWKPAFLSNEEFTHLILEALDGFIVVFSAAGHVHYVSESVTALLGHLPSELLNTSVYELVWDEEQAALYQALVGGGGSNSGGGNNGGQLAFQAHLRRARPHPAEDTYELVNFQGYLRTDVEPPSPPTYSTAPLLFVGTARLHTPQLIREMSVVDAAEVSGQAAGRGAAEFTSRHSLEWKFLFLDHRAPPIIGYLPFEVLGTSGYDYYHVDDLDKVVSCHEALMQKGEGTSCYYRFLTKGQQWIWLQTRFYITYHQWNSKPEFIVCTHRVVSYVDVMKQTRKPQPAQSPTLPTPSINTTSLVGASSMPRSVNSAPNSGTSSPWGGVGSGGAGPGVGTGTTASAGTGTRSDRSRRHTSRRTPSDCTSMSADSPASNVTASRQHGGRSSRLSSHSHNTVSGPPSSGHVSGPGPPSNSHIPGPGSSHGSCQGSSQGPISAQGSGPGPATIPVATSGLTSTTLVPGLAGQPPTVMFTEPPPQTQYVAAIPVQSAVIAGFPTSAAAVLSPMPQAVDSGAMVLSETQLQAQLQRKHAELQAIIGQQQAELRRVSEQLLMARLGLLAPVQQTQNPQQHHQQSHHHQPHQHHQQSHQQHQHHQQSHQHQQHHQQSHQHSTMLTAVSVPYVCNSNVSSTTSVAPGGLQPSVDVIHQQVDDPSAAMALGQQQAQMLFSQPSSSSNQLQK